MASDDSNSDDAFDGAMEGLVENIRDRLSPELRALIGRRFEGQGNNSANASLKVLSKFLKLSAKQCSPWVNICVGNAILDKSDPVDLFFSCLPDPKSHEMGYVENGGLAIINAYDHAHEVLKHFTLVQGRKMLKRKYKATVPKATLLDKLFEILDQENGHTGWSYAQWSEDFLSLVWEIPREMDIQRSYNEKTASLIEYLRWEIRGRKDANCPVQKPWTTLDPAELRRSAYDDLSRLPRNALPGNCAKCSAEGADVRCTCCWLSLDGGHEAAAVYCSVECCQEDSKRHRISRQEFEEISRRAKLFQIGFTQYLLSINHTGKYIVSEDDGMVEVFMNGSAPEDLQTESIYEGVCPDLDLALPKVEAALHAFGCCFIKNQARELLEYFFRTPSTSIEFLDFVPKNAHTPVLEHLGYGRSRFNMSPSHTVAIIRTESGLQFILDPTAAQYGWRENIAPREIYARCRIDRELDTTACLAPTSPGPRTEYTPRPKDASELLIWEYKCVAEATVDFAKDHFSGKFDLEATLQLPQSEFEEQCLALKETLKSGMGVRDKYKAFIEEHGAMHGSHS